MDNKVMFYYNPMSRGRIAHWMLEEVGADYETKLLKWETGDHKSPDYLKINPMGKIPAIVYKGVVVTENAAICTYLADAFPQLKITTALGTKGPVPVSARVNDSEPFLASLYPVGNGRHYLRVKNKICKSVNIKEGSRVRVEITVRDRSKEISIPKDVKTILKNEGVEKEFKNLPIGKKSYLLRLIDEAVKPETRKKRIQAAVKEAIKRKKD